MTLPIGTKADALRALVELLAEIAVKDTLAEVEACRSGSQPVGGMADPEPKGS